MESREADIILRDLCNEWSDDVGTQLEYLLRLLTDETYWRIHGEMLSLTIAEELRIEEWTRMQKLHAKSMQFLGIREQLRAEEL